MPYFKVNPQTGEILSEQLTVPPDEVHGLADESLADLGATFPDRPEYQGVGYWPETRIASEFNPATSVPSDVWVPFADVEKKSVAARQELRQKSSAELSEDKKFYVKGKLAETDAEFSPRWIEDIASGDQHNSFLSWKARRDDLRAQLSAIGS